MIKIKKILVPTDLREQSLAGIKYALSLARDHDAEVLIVHVVDEERITTTVRLPEEEMLFPREWLSMGEGARRFLDIELKEKRLDLYAFLSGHFDLQELKAGRVTRLVRMGDVAQEIVSVAVEEHCDLIVMASRGQGWLGRMLSGSMSEEVAHKAPCPVLTIQPSAVVQDNGRWVQARSLVERGAVSHA